MSRTLTLTALACATFASLALTGCGDQRELEYKEVEIQELRRQNKELENELAKRSSGQAEKSLEQSNAAGASAATATGAAIPEAQVSTREHAQEIVIALDNAILFKSGSATLSTQAKGVLAKAATVLNKQYPGDFVRVVGHTDDDKITRSKGTFDDNWDLAGARARAVRSYLQERGVDVSRMTFEGCADQRPLVANTSDANRAKNRRVEIVVLPSTGGKPSTK